MKFQVERDALADALAWVARALPSRPVVPVLSGLRLEAGDGLTLSCFDYEVSATAHLDADVAEPGAVLVPGRLLAEITRSLPALAVDFAADGDVVKPDLRERGVHRGPAARRGVSGAPGTAGPGRHHRRRRPGHGHRPGAARGEPR